MRRRRPSPPSLILGGMIALYVAVFGWLTWRHEGAYGSFGYDMGLHDQAIWLVSRFEQPFVTIRGMHYFGHHVNLISLLYVPFYWLGAGPRFLYLSETVALAAGAVPVWLLARDRWQCLSQAAPDTIDVRLAGARCGHSRWTALVPAAAFLLYPSLQWINWWHWHPEALAITPLLFAWWLARTSRWRWFAVAVALALATKEDVALAVLMLGIVIAVVLRRWRVGALTAAAGGGWFAVCVRLIIPRFLDGIPFYERQLFPEFGTSFASVVIGLATHPLRVVELATEPDRLTYYLKLLGPLAFVPLLGLPLLLIAGPQVGVNILSALPGTYDIRFQYSSVVVAAVFVAAVEGMSWVRRPGQARWAFRVLVVAVGAASLVSNVAWSPSPIGRDFSPGVWARRVPRHEAFDAAIALVGPNDGVTANYYLIPHLTHRRYAFEWPNPFILANWGIADEHPPDAASATWLVIDTTLNQESELLERLTAPGGGYDIRFVRDGVIAARLVDSDAARAAAIRRARVDRGAAPAPRT